MIEAAREASPDIEFEVADAARLPLQGASADLAVAFMSLQDVDDMPAAVREIGRVLEPGGRLVMAIVHPLNSAGLFDNDLPTSPFTITGSYLEPFHYVDDVDVTG